MRTLVIGSGGREHALAWKLAQEGHEVACAPGNPGTAQIGPNFDAPVHDRRALLMAANNFKPDLIVIGPEDPLIAGLADMFRENGFKVFGPGQDAARLEGSKAFAKDMMKRSGVPTAEYQVFSDPGAANEFVASRFGAGRQVAVKASGAAQGKGVVLCSSQQEAEEAVARMLIEKSFGEAGRTIVVEDKLVGREFSLMTLVSGGDICSLPVARDYKRVWDGDEGLNTGGMGTCSPVAEITDDVVARTEETVVRPILGTLAELGIDFRGVLFSGLMMTESGPECLEYNVRFGDPETQTVVSRLDSGLGDALMACALGEPIPAIKSKAESVVSVVLASAGYPDPYQTGLPISMGRIPEGVNVFHAGTAEMNGKLVTSGGRVMAVTATAADLNAARALAYQACHAIEFTGKHYRTDIGA